MRICTAVGLPGGTRARAPAARGLFVAYSATLAVTERAERSLIGDHADERARSTACGQYHLTARPRVLPGALLFGVLWERFGSATAFATAAAATALAGAVLVGLAGTRSRASR